MATGKPDVFARAKSKAAVQPATKAKKDEMRHVTVPDALRPRFVELCELGYIATGLKGVIESRKEEISGEFIKFWVHEMWETRKKPDNFRAVVLNGPIQDCVCNFLLKFRKDAIKGKLPTQEEIPEGKTFEEEVMAILRGTGIGLSDINAKRFVQEEIVVTETFGQRSYDELYAAEEGTPEKSAATKLLTYMQCRSQAAKAKLALFTDEEEQACLVVHQTITLKEGLADRLFTYCDSEEQLLALVKWINVTDELSRFMVGEGEEKRPTQWRLAKTMVRFLFGEEWTPEMVAHFLFGKAWTTDLAEKLVKEE